MTTLADAIANPAGAAINPLMGEQADAASKSVVLSTGSKAKLDTLHADIVALQTSVAATNTKLDSIISDTSDSGVSPHQPCDMVTVTPTLDTSIYASGDILFGSTIVTNAVRIADGLAQLNSVVVIDKDDQKPEFALKFWSANVTYGTINAAPTISDTDAASCLGRVNIVAADYDDDGGASTAFKDNIGKILKAASGTRNIYITGKLTAGTPTHTASGLIIRLGLVWS